MNKSIEYFEAEKKKLKKKLARRLEEIDEYYFDLEHNWRVSEAKRLIEEIQLMTNAIESIKQMQKGCNDDTKRQTKTKNLEIEDLCEDNV